MFTNNHFIRIMRTATLLLVVLAALAVASPALADEREPDPDYCATHGNVYFWSQIASEDYINDAVGNDNWVIGGHYLIGQQTLDNGYILQFWIHIIGYGHLDKYEIEEYFFLPICENDLTITHFDDLLVNKFVNPVLIVVDNNRGTLLTAGETPLDTTDLPEIKSDDDDNESYPPDPIEPSTNEPSTPADDGDGGVIIVAGPVDDIILVPIPIPQVP